MPCSATEIDVSKVYAVLLDELRQALEGGRGLLGTDYSGKVRGLLTDERRALQERRTTDS
jgi:hypothetical protein